MSLGSFSYPLPVNEPVLSYAPGSPERAKIKARLAELKAECPEIPMIIGGKEVRTANLHEIRPPHETSHLLARYCMGGKEHVEAAVSAALAAKPAWEAMPWEDRAAIFLRAADLIATKHRWNMNGTTMLGQSKNVYQAEIDAACEIVDFLRFNVAFLAQIMAR